MPRKPSVNDYVNLPRCPLCGNQMVDSRDRAKFQCWPEHGGCGAKIQFNDEMVATLRSNPVHPKFGPPRRFLGR